MDMDMVMDMGNETMHGLVCNMWGVTEKTEKEGRGAKDGTGRGRGRRWGSRTWTWVVANRGVQRRSAD
jgi:hypothetical protein